MNQAEQKLKVCYEQMKKKITFQPEIGIILGSGLGDYAEQIDIVETLLYQEIDGFPSSTVAGHKGRFVFGYVKDVPVVIMQGRVHFYEGYPMTDVVLPVRLMGLMGIKQLVLTNAAGGINFDFRPGDFMMIQDQITSFVENPLIGPNMEELGDRFPDMSHVYDEEWCQKIKKIASAHSIPLKEGVYVQLTGPSYETPAEIRMLRTLGADAAGMSTAVEALTANHMGIKVCGISCITNMAAGISREVLSHVEVQETADRVAVSFKELLTQIILNR